MIFILFVYALIWQQVLKTFRLPFAMCNKVITIVWGMLFSALIFNEQITLKKITGALIILSGIMMLSSVDNTEASEGETE